VGPRRLGLKEEENDSVSFLYWSVRLCCALWATLHSIMHLEEEKEREKEGEETKLRISVGLVGGWSSSRSWSLIKKSWLNA
jgi:hypothetical protein